MGGQSCTARRRHVCAFTLDIDVPDTHPPHPHTRPSIHLPSQPPTQPPPQRERERERERERVKKKETNKQTKNKDGMSISKRDTMRAHQNYITTLRKMRHLV